MSLRINDRKDGFVLDGEPFFYMADTVWSVFSNTPLEEWKEYLEYRRRQSFNVLQITVMPVLHDTSDTYVRDAPFHTNADGSWDFARINGKFFDTAEEMVAMATDCGFICALVVLWANYVPDTVFSKADSSKVMPFEAVRPYTEYVVKRFSAYRPIYLISGDTDFGSEQSVAHYMEALRTVKELSPDSLTTLHLNGCHVLSEETFLQAKELDFYMYQSSHNLESQRECYRMAEKHYALDVKRPIVNGEPCYEGHGHGNRYGRFDAFDIRKAFWWSVLAGAKAGFGYGTHGLFSWHRTGAEFTSEAWSKIPYDWRAALRFEGAWDAGYCKWLFERFGLHDVEPANDRLLTPYEEIRAAASPDLSKVAVYVPYSNDVRLAIDLTGYKTEMFDLARKRVLNPVVDAIAEGSVIRMIEDISDVVIIAVKSGAAGRD